jgi:hypothetical protein
MEKSENELPVRLAECKDRAVRTGKPRRGCSHEPPGKPGPGTTRHRGFLTPTRPPRLLHPPGVSAPARSPLNGSVPSSDRGQR